MLSSLRRLMTSTASLSVIAIATSGAIGTEPAKAKPVEYVKICSLYGAGFYYIPGTNTCAKIYAGVEGGYGWSNNNFAVNPAFDVNGSGGVFGVNGGVQFGIPGTSVYVGPMIGGLWGNMGGTTANPPASPGNSYSANRAFIQFASFTVGVTPSFFDIYSSPAVGWFRAPHIEGDVGIANIKTDVSCSCGASDSATRTGFTGSVGIGLPIANTPIELFLRYRYINVPSANFNIPGQVPISGNINLVTFGAQWSFGGSSPGAPR